MKSANLKGAVGGELREPKHRSRLGKKVKINHHVYSIDVNMSLDSGLKQRNTLKHTKNLPDPGKISNQTIANHNTPFFVNFEFDYLFLLSRTNFFREMEKSLENDGETDGENVISDRKPNHTNKQTAQVKKTGSGGRIINI